MEQIGPMKTIQHQTPIIIIIGQIIIILQMEVMELMKQVIITIGHIITIK